MAGKCKEKLNSIKFLLYAFYAPKIFFNVIVCKCCFLIYRKGIYRFTYQTFKSAKENDIEFYQKKKTHFHYPFGKHYTADGALQKKKNEISDKIDAQI